MSTWWASCLVLGRGMTAAYTPSWHIWPMIELFVLDDELEGPMHLGFTLFFMGVFVNPFIDKPTTANVPIEAVLCCIEGKEHKTHSLFLTVRITWLVLCEKRKYQVEFESEAKKKNEAVDRAEKQRDSAKYSKSIIYFHTKEDPVNAWWSQIIFSTQACFPNIMTSSDITCPYQWLRIVVLTTSSPNSHGLMWDGLRYSMNIKTLTRRDSGQSNDLGTRLYLPL